MKNRKGFTPLIAILLIGSLLAVAVVAVENDGVNDLTATMSGNLMQGSWLMKPLINYMKYEAYGASTTTKYYDVPEDGIWINPPKNTDKYTLQFKLKDSNSAKIEYYICNSKVLDEKNCRDWSEFKQLKKRSSTVDLEVEYDEYVWVQFQQNFIWNYAIDDGQFRFKYQPFALVMYSSTDVQQGPVNANGNCVTSSHDSWKDRIIDSDNSEIGRMVDSSVNEQCLEPNERRFFLGGYVNIYGPNSQFEYKGEDAWCEQKGSYGQIYKVNTITTGDGREYKLGSTNWADMIGTEKCCPGEIKGDQVCQDDFSWKLIKNSECSRDSDCGVSSWTPYADNKITKYECVNEICSQEIKKVECASNTDCSAQGKICDTVAHKCIKASTNLDGEDLITIPETQEKCLEKNGNWIPEKQKQKTAFFGLYKKGTEITPAHCNMDKGFNINWVSIIVLIILIIGIYFAWPYILSGFKILKGILKKYFPFLP